MDRITHKYVGGQAFVSLNLVSKMGENECVGLPITKLARYEDLEEQGLLLKLPCKDVFYIVDKGTKYEMIMSKSIDNLNLYEIRGIDKDGYYWSTRKLAEERLKESGG